MIVFLVQIAGVAALHVSHHVGKAAACCRAEEPAAFILSVAICDHVDSIAKGADVQQSSRNSPVFLVEVDGVMFVSLLRNQVEATWSEIAMRSCHGGSKCTPLARSARMQIIGSGTTASC